MISPLQAIRKILWGNVTVDGRTIPVIQRTYPYDKTPCITIDDSGGSKFKERYITTEKYPLPTDHPQYSIEYPFEKYPQQVLREYYETTININVWSDNGDEREKINQKVQELFYQAQSDHYLFCTHYNNHDCTSMGTRCLAEYFQTDKRGNKQQCPNPLVYNYENIFTHYNLIRASFYVEQPFSLNDINKDEPVYRSVFKLHTGYYNDHIIGGIIPQKLKLSKDTIIL